MGMMAMLVTKKPSTIHDAWRSSCQLARSCTIDGSAVAVTSSSAPARPAATLRMAISDQAARRLTAGHSRPAVYAAGPR